MNTVNNTLNKYESMVTRRSWDVVLKDILILKMDYIFEQIGEEYYPNYDNIFRVFNTMDPSDIKVVILGQDPYHNGEADGLAFSCANKIQSSLRNIAAEIKSDIGIEYSGNKSLSRWIDEGVFLLNSALTVKPKSPESHLFYWEDITDNVIKYISDNFEKKVFILWGKFAQKKIKLIDNTKHHIIIGYHPSFYSAVRFFGGKYFSNCNNYLTKNNIKEINWNI